MSTFGFDPEILQDFLTESGELIAQLEGDLVTLESNPRDPELLNQVFRALHTIKGSASFLALTNLVGVAHAAESALNSARNNVIVVDRPVMDLLLEAADTIKGQLTEITAGEPLRAGRPELISQLTILGEGKQLSSTVTATVAAGSNASAKPVASQSASTTNANSTPIANHGGGASSISSVTKLELGPGKADLLEFLVADLEETLKNVESSIASLSSDATRSASAAGIADLCEQLGRSIEFFEFVPMLELTRALGNAADRVKEVPSNALGNVTEQFRQIHSILNTQTQGIKQGELRTVVTTDLLTTLEATLNGDHAPTPATTPTQGETAPATWCEPADAASSPTSTPTTALTQAAPATAAPTDHDPASTKRGVAPVENTIRVEVGRLEALMNLVGELVLQKNRVAALTRRASASANLEAELAESLTLAAGTLDRVTGDIQTAVMRTRMQPLEKLFGKYPRLIRDLATKTGKKIHLVVEGGETEVDKSVIEELGDPLVHLMRNSADHGLEGPEERLKAGKNETGTITLRASQEGSHVLIQIIDDGRGLSRDRIGKKAIERGMVSPEALAAMSDRDVFKFILAAGFSTADQVSDLSGRGVGMDVVCTNISKLKGTVDLNSEFGKGTTISITIPLTVAILPAMMVGVGNEIYAIPLTSILEIVRPQPEQVYTIGEHPVLRLRNSVLPLVEASGVFDQPTTRRDEAPFAVILQQGDDAIGLMVSRLIGQQEVVIKPLDEVSTNGASGRRATSGATVRDDGGVSLIADVGELFRFSKAVRSGKPTVARK